MNKEIIKLIEQRLEKGKKEYNEELDVNDGRNWLQEALEEQLDGMVYIAAKLLQLKTKNDRDVPSESAWEQLLNKAQEMEDYAGDAQQLSEDLRIYIAEMGKMRI